MGEKLPLIGGAESLHLDPAEAEAQLETIRRSLEAQAKQTPSGELTEKVAREQVERHALPTERYEVEAERAAQNSSRTSQNSSSSVYQSSLESAQGRLSAPERAFSRVVHHPVIEALSTGLEKTVARPSVLLGAFFMSALGSVLIYLLAVRNGYAINTHYVFVLLLFGGAILGALYDLWRWLRRHLTN